MLNSGVKHTTKLETLTRKLGAAEGRRWIFQILCLHFKFVFQAFQVSMHIPKALVFGQVHKDPGRAAPISLPTETAIADASTRWAMPVWIQQSILDLFTITISKAGTAELASNAPALWVSAVCFGINSFLAALMTSRSQ